MTQARTSIEKSPTAKPARLADGPSAQTEQPGPAGGVLRLQRTVGNRAVGRLLQAKVKVNAPGDRYEQEADRIADQVMRMADPRLISSSMGAVPAVQRKCATCASGGAPCAECAEEGSTVQRMPLAAQVTRLIQRLAATAPAEREDEEERLQAKEAAGATPAVTPAAEIEIAGLRGGGVPLPPSERSFFEPRFGYDFSNVRLHTGTPSAKTARAVNARAFTVGSDVAFGAGEYAAETVEGRRLLAHELTHVVQQSVANTLLAMGIGELGRSAKAEAEQSVMDVFGWGAAHPHGRPPVALQRRTIFEEIAGLFRGDDFPEEELLTYLGLLDRTHAIEDYTDSDNKARAVVRRWKRGDSRFLLTPSRKILLIKEMLSGITGDDDEQAILVLLRGSGDTEFAHILSTIGEDSLHSAFHGEEQEQLDLVLAARRRRPPRRPERERAETSEVFTPEMVIDLQRRFMSNAEDTNRLNCILIIRDIAPRLFASDPELAERVRVRLSRLRGRSLTMTDLGRAMEELGLASAYRRIRFNNGNGREEPTEMAESAWGAIMNMVGDVPGWHVFGMAVFDGYHSVTILVENRPDGPRLYWADQWRIDPGDDFHEEEGSVSGFRRYEQPGFDRFLNEYTQSRWRTVFKEKGKRYDATLHIWKFRSSLSEERQR